MNHTLCNEQIQQPSLFDAAQNLSTILSLSVEPVSQKRKRKHIEHHLMTASVEAFEQIKTRRNKAYLLILRLLKEFDFAEPERNLTAREMLRLLKSRGQVKPDAERNYLSPRLTELLDFNCVENPMIEGAIEHYLKRVESDAIASVWRITSRGHELLNCLDALSR